MEKKTLRLPAHLIDAFSECCWEQDMLFLSELSKLIDVSVPEMRKTLLLEDSKQVVSVAVEDKSKYLHDIQCPAMLKQEDGSYIRCSGYRICFEKKCSLHKISVSNKNLKWMSDPIFSTGEYVKIIEDGITIFCLKEMEEKIRKNLSKDSHSDSEESDSEDSE
jgi:hypothetical protein